MLPFCIYTQLGALIADWTGSRNCFRFPFTVRQLCLSWTRFQVVIFSFCSNFNDCVTRLYIHCVRASVGSLHIVTVNIDVSIVKERLVRLFGGDQKVMHSGI